MAKTSAFSCVPLASINVESFHNYRISFGVYNSSDRFENQKHVFDTFGLYPNHSKYLAVVIIMDLSSSKIEFTNLISPICYLNDSVDENNFSAFIVGENNYNI